MLQPLTPEQRDLAEAHRGIAVMVVDRFRSRYQGDDAREELLAIAFLALCRAAQGFDPARGFAFSTYAAKCCKLAIIEEWFDDSLIRTPHYLGRRAHADHPYQAVRDRVRAARPVESVLKDQADLTANPVEQVIFHEMRDRVRRLPDRERYVVERILDGWTQAEIGCEMGHSRHTINKVLVSARARLRKHGLSSELFETT